MDKLEGGNKKRGRPIGFKLSDKTKDLIRKKRLGKNHTNETKTKISKSMFKYFKDGDPLVDSIKYDNRNLSPEINEWLDINNSVLNNSPEVLTNRRIVYLSQIERLYGDCFDNMFGHNLTPEFLLLLKEELINRGFINKLKIFNSVVLG